MDRIIFKIRLGILKAKLRFHDPHELLFAREKADNERAAISNPRNLKSHPVPISSCVGFRPIRSPDPVGRHKLAKTTAIRHGLPCRIETHREW
jgi:hypothetical protein